MAVKTPSRMPPRMITMRSRLGSAPHHTCRSPSRHQPTMSANALVSTSAATPTCRPKTNPFSAQPPTKAIRHSARSAQSVPLTRPVRGARAGAASRPYPFFQETMPAATMMQTPTRMPGRMPARNMAAMETDPAATE